MPIAPLQRQMRSSPSASGTLCATGVIGCVGWPKLRLSDMTGLAELAARARPYLTGSLRDMDLSREGDGLLEIIVIDRGRAPRGWGAADLPLALCIRLGQCSPPEVYNVDVEKVAVHLPQCLAGGQSPGNTAVDHDHAMLGIRGILHRGLNFLLSQEFEQCSLEL